MYHADQVYMEESKISRDNTIMELALVGGLAALGYFLKDSSEIKSKPLESMVLDPGMVPSSRNIYENTRYAQVRQQEQTMADDLYNRAKKPWETGIVPPFMNSEPNALTRPPPVDTAPEVSLQQKPFAAPHNNFVPFFGSSIKQNTNPTQNESLLESYTGTNKIIPRKTETAAFFNPAESRTNINGYQFQPDLSRYIPSQTSDGVKSFQPVMVGPGLAQGPTSVPTGGFQDFYRPPTKGVDDLRVKPKRTYEGVILPPKALNAARGEIGEVSKSNPETMRQLTSDDWFRTTGAVTGNTQRPVEIIKPTHRIISKPLQGGVGPATIEKEEARPGVRVDRRQTFKTDGPRNASASDMWTVAGDMSDYGKTSIANRDNERTLTSCRTYNSNVRDVVGREIAPSADKARDTKKQDLVTYSRRGNAKLKGIKELPVDNWKPLKTTNKETLIHDTSTGNFGNTGASKLTVHDPRDTARKTIKETLLHDPHTGNLDAPKTSATGAINKDDWRFRTTLRETQIHNPHTGNLEAPKTSPIGAVNKDDWRFRTTLRETQPHNKFGNAPQNAVLTGRSKETQKYADEMRMTTKETLITDAELANLMGTVKAKVYDPRDVPSTTIKETTTDATRLANMNAGLLQGGDGYLTTEADARPTNRQFSSEEYFGDAAKDMGEGYLTANPTAKQTMRQSYSDENYMGPAESADKAEMSAEQYCNAQFNTVRENLLKGRAPTQESVKIPLGEDAINMESKHLLPEEIMRDLALQRSTQMPLSYNECTDTRQSNKISDFADDRLDVRLLDAIKTNPLHVEMVPV